MQFLVTLLYKKRTSAIQGANIFSDWVVHISFTIPSHGWFDTAVWQGVQTKRVTAQVISLYAPDCEIGCTEIIMLKKLLKVRNFDLMDNRFCSQQQVKEHT